MTYKYHSKHKLIPVDSWIINSYKSSADRNGYSTAKWVLFCEILLSDGFDVSYYGNKKTVSKYVHIKTDKSDPFVVRFSNHKPMKNLEEKETCNFFVGVNNFKVTRTEDALKAVYKHFKIKPRTKLYFDFMDGIKAKL